MIGSGLENLLRETEKEAQTRQDSQFDLACGPSERPLILFGAGNLGRWILRELRKLGKEPAALADNNGELWGTSIEGVAVLSPADAARKFAKDGLFVVSIWNPQVGVERIFRQLRVFGCRTVVPFVWLFWKHPSVFLPYYLWDAPSSIISQAANVRRAFAALADGESRDLFLSHLRLRLTGDFSSLPQPASCAQYFPPDLYLPVDHECFVDCGAYNGDTIRAFTQWTSGRFRRIVAFEPDPANFAALEACLSEELKLGDRAVARRCASGSVTGRVRFSADGSQAAAIAQHGAAEVDCVRLDDALAEEHPTFIKMDIEGAEPDAIEGATQLIRRDQLLMAVCVYHRQSDLWRIPLMIDAVEPGSNRLYLKQHAVDGFDLVCYSVPKARSLPEHN
jgi:FkbM family methyltransferase